MKICLHVGTEKTGSSFLQKLCGTHREFLAGQGVFFPDAGRDEERLIGGSISPGNARELAQLIEHEQWEATDKWLAERANQAVAKGADQLLLSHELLFAALSSRAAIKRLEEAARRIGVGEVGALLMVRDPVEQAISLYKHRAKSGRVGDLSTWLTAHYRVPGDIKAFLSAVEAGETLLRVRKYEKDTARLTDAFFCDWLGVTPPPVETDTSVNPSLTLSELRLIRQLASTRPDAVPLFYANLLAVPRAQKADEPHLEAAARREVAEHLARYADVWSDLDARLESDGGLDVAQAGEHREEATGPFCFSEAQLAAMARSHEVALSPTQQARVLGRSLRGLVARTRRRAGTLLRRGP